MRSYLLVFALVLPLPAQGVLPLSGKYQLGALGTAFVRTCQFNTIPEVYAEAGTVSFKPDGTYTASVIPHEVCAGGRVITGPPDVSNGIYLVGNDGRILFDDDPMSPGTDTYTAFLRADAAVAFGSRDEESEEAELVVIVALSSSQSRASLRGSYHVARMVQRNDTTALTLHSELGVIVFDGNGGYTESGMQHKVVYNGTATLAPYSVSSGTYVVAADGTLTTVAGTTGAVSADGEIFFWIRQAGVEVELTVGIRQGSTYGSPLITGAWGIAGMEDSIGALALPNGPILRTDFGTLTFNGQGSMSGSLYHVDLTPSVTNSNTNAIAGPFTLGATGVLSLTLTGSSAIPGALSSDGTLLIATTRPKDGVGLMIGGSRCAWPAQVGAGTPGSGGASPILQSYGGFPWAGNAGFGFLVSGGRGGAQGALLFASGTSNGIPLLGGTVWLDIAQIFASFPLSLSGPAGVPAVGAAGLPFGLPANFTLAGASLAGQAFVLDPAAPQGLAMTAALQAVVCR